MKVRYLLKNAKFFSQGVFHLADVFLSDGKIVSIGDGVSPSNDTIVIDISNMVLFMFMFIFVSRDFLIRRPSAPAHWLPRTAALPTLPTCRT